MGKLTDWLNGKLNLTDDDYDEMIEELEQAEKESEQRAKEIRNQAKGF